MMTFNNKAVEREALQRLMWCLFSVAILWLLCFCPEAMAMSMDHDTAMKDALKGLEDTFTGGYARMVAIGAILIGFFLSMIEASPKPILLACLVVVVAKLVMKYADTSYTLLI